jgi:hypothetical protein
MPSDGPGAQPPVIKAFKEGPDIITINSRGGLFDFVKESREFSQIAAIAFDAMGSEAFLDPCKI